ncbi:agmatinase [Malassezia pachydermatis]|uniref:Agmatinase n=1 Tax=Malassezia pachydermatis TaxID=77020 RepID=A0A0M9VQ94_9BASI|nr:agmatinase [Malassezia pachydermatis]KOS15283.1 agmatinase [Malassezia pachydermatis]
MFWYTLACVFTLCALVRARDPVNQWDVPDFYFSGVSTFAHLPHEKCLVQEHTDFDVAVLGVPLDTAVSYRPGARFGPRAIRAGSARQTVFRSFNPALGVNPYVSKTKFLDCGDIPVTPFDNELAFQQIEDAYDDLLHRNVPQGPGTISALPSRTKNGKPVHFAKDKKQHPRMAVMGGDHSIALPILRSLNKVYGPVSVLHFDSHLDTWAPNQYGAASRGTGISGYTHGTMLYHASQEGLVSNTSMHVGLRGLLSGADFEDYRRDASLGFTYLETWEVDQLGLDGTVAAIRERLGDSPVYLSIDIDVLDPSIAPGTGTPVSGGLTSRELRSIIRMLSGINLVGCEVVEVSPPYDTNGEVTALAAAELLYELMSVMAIHPLDKVTVEPQARPPRPVSAAAPPLAEARQATLSWPLLTLVPAVSAALATVLTMRLLSRTTSPVKGKTA